MTHAYNESYLNDAMNNLGDMFDYAVRVLGYNGDKFMEYFLSSGVAHKFETANPKYIAGMSGIELCERVLQATQPDQKLLAPEQREFDGVEFWVGWILAYYQWESNLSFSQIVSCGLTYSKIESLYILHEADTSKFTETANKIIMRRRETSPTNLQTIRKSRGYTQKKLSDESGVKLRMIQLYEQRKNDINKASISVVSSLAKSLGCLSDDLMETVPNTI